VAVLVAVAIGEAGVAAGARVVVEREVALEGALGLVRREAASERGEREGEGAEQRGRERTTHG
jgi:hypothetical protein